MIWILVVTYFTWFFSEVLISLYRRSEKTEEQSKDKGSLALIWTVIITANFVGYFISMWIPAPIAENQYIRYIGLAVIIIGVILRLTIIGSLGKFFTVNVTIREDHKLKTDGFYKYLRHPSYSASLLSFAGYGISLNNWISLAIIFCSVLTAFLIRIRIEERVLAAHFGTSYAEYTARTKRLIPFVF
jgi:protein-S-isoprenylcysteine O-methyltransferase Ste14